jgi:dsDNA-specific endonuclease/ATPase MutS2
MSGTDNLVDEMIAKLRQERDELRVQLHLGKKEVQDKWQQLSDQLAVLNERYEPAKQAAKESASDIWQALKLVGEEIRDGFQEVRKSLK